MIPRSEIVNCLRRELGWNFNDQTKRVEIYSRGEDRIVLPRRDLFTEDEAATILRQGGASPGKCADFMKSCVKH